MARSLRRRSPNERRWRGGVGARGDGALRRPELGQRQLWCYDARQGELVAVFVSWEQSEHDDELKCKPQCP